jgi:centriolar protein POC1
VIQNQNYVNDEYCGDSREKAQSIQAHMSTVRSVEFSHDDRWLVSASDDKSVKVWDAERRTFMFSLKGHVNWVRDAKFNRNCGSDDKTVKLWDLEKHNCLQTFYDHTG